MSMTKTGRGYAMMFQERMYSGDNSYEEYMDYMYHLRMGKHPERFPHDDVDQVERAKEDLSDLSNRERK